MPSSLHPWFAKAALWAAVALAQPAASQQVTLVNMIPNALSAETARDAEPNLAVNPALPSQIVGSAFTPEPMGGANLPLFVSTDGGQNWTLTTPALIPGTIIAGGCPAHVCDITVRFAGTSGLLYVSALNPIGGTSSTSQLQVWRLIDPTGAAPVIEALETRSAAGGLIADQPYIQAATDLVTGQDRVFIGINDQTMPGGRTATIDHTLNATPPSPAGFSSTVIEARATTGQDGFSIRPAIHASGVVYAVFYGQRPGGVEVVVVRDDNWGSGATPFQALIDGDGQPGIRVAAGLSMGAGSVGTQRVGFQDAIAVDPNDSQTVYIVYAEGATSANYTLHVRRSTMGGAAGTWSGDLKTVSPATNPGIAVNTLGQVGFLYQRLVAGGWETHFERSSDGGGTWPTDVLLANVPDSAGPSYGGANPIGDYASLLAIGKDFYGIFSANNTPDTANFYPGVVFRRAHDFTTKTLKDLSDNPVSVSIDPFFFRVSDVTPSQDFYVRDWSDSPASHDNGQEPSTNSVFYLNSDVWNRRDNTRGGFDAGTDRPDHQDPQEAADGNNFAFVRVHRNAPATAGSPDVAVQARFLYADFGLGTSYVDAAAAPAATLTFAAADVEQSLADGAGYQWTLPATHSTHVCLAVEISAPGDNYAGELAGNAPGWPTTDLMVINDNNKAQRNMGIWTPPMPPPMGGADTLTYYAMAHNAATYPRDMVLRYSVTPETARRLSVSAIEVMRGPRVAGIVADVPARQLIQVPKDGTTITLKGMQPGENRWLGVTMRLTGANAGELLGVQIVEVGGGKLPLNGITIAARPAPLETSIAEVMRFHGAVFRRMAALVGSSAAKELAAATDQARKAGIKGADYGQFVRNHQPRIGAELDNLIKVAPSGDPFGLKAAHARLAAVNNALGRVVVAHSALLQKLDAHMTMLDKAKGDTADILHTVYWQRALYRRTQTLKSLAERVAPASTEFIRAFQARKARAPEYQKLLGAMQGTFVETSKLLKDPALEQAAAQIAKHEGDAQAQQGAHRSFLLRLSALSK